jgi:cell division protein FtsL
MAVPATRVTPARPRTPPRPSRVPARPRSAAPAAVPRRLRPESSPARRPAPRRRRIPFLLFALLLVAATVVGLVSAQALVAQESFRIADLLAEADRLEASYGRLRLEVAELSAPDRIVEAARKAGLVLPEEVEVLRLPAIGGGSDNATQGADSVLALKGVLGGER